MKLPELPPVLVGPSAGRDPVFAWRGLHLDCARTFFGTSCIKTVISLAARYGFNRLHWHLTDDEGWRFAVPGYPLLTQVGATLPRQDFRFYQHLYGETRERAVAEAPGRWQNGFYTDDDIQDIVTHAASLGITVIPEVDIPGHMAAAIASYPQLGRPDTVNPPSGSVRDDIYWPARNDLLWPTDAAADFVKAAVERIATLFPGTWIHIGGDECAYKQWEADPEILDLVRKRGVASVAQLQSWFIDQAREVSQRQGKRLAAWDEVCALTGDEDFLVFVWNEAEGLERIRNTSQEFVFTDARTLYLNRIDPKASSPQKGMLPGISVNDILAAPWEETANPRCVGVQACLWTEFILDEADMAQMLFPRLLAVSERMWNPQVDVFEAAQRVETEYHRLVAGGVFDS